MNLRKRVAIDLGTTSVLVYTRTQGVVLNEPSIVAIDRFTNQVLAVGREAKEMLGRTPGHIIALRPLQDGVIKDYDSTEKMLKYFIRNSVGKTLLKPNVIICVPSGATQVQKRAVKQAGIKAGANEVHLIEEPLAAAIGAGLEISENRGQMIIDIGGGTTDIAVIAHGGIVVSDSIRIAGDEFDQEIIDFIRRRDNVIIGEKTAEKIKFSIGSSNTNDITFMANGRDLKTGLPKQVELSIDDIDTAFGPIIDKIGDAIRRVITKTPPELVSDIFESGAIIAGGGALIRGMQEGLSEITKVNMIVADNPQSCVVKGTGKALNWIHELEHIEDSKVEMTRRIVEENEKLRRR